MVENKLNEIEQSEISYNKLDEETSLEPGAHWGLKIKLS